MALVGDEKAGFSVDFDASAATVRVRAWGFWSPAVAAAFCPAIETACRDRAAGLTLAMDMNELKPMREEGQASFSALVTLLPRLGIAKATATSTNQLTKLQLLRVAAEGVKKGTIRIT
ncbi:MAG TPA: hypothetical protein VL400_08475 [Polyangiaceae bacterium]|jgi:hypothetical protein|nr:hypothetical protein [Polyangiaceae bacterium]